MKACPSGSIDILALDGFSVLKNPIHGVMNTTALAVVSVASCSASKWLREIMLPRHQPILQMKKVPLSVYCCVSVDKFTIQVELLYLTLDSVYSKASLN